MSERLVSHSFPSLFALWHTLTSGQGGFRCTHRGEGTLAGHPRALEGRWTVGGQKDVTEVVVGAGPEVFDAGNGDPGV